MALTTSKAKLTTAEINAILVAELKVQLQEPVLELRGNMMFSSKRWRSCELLFYVILNVRNEISTLKNPYLDTKITSLSYLGAEI